MASNGEYREQHVYVSVAKHLWMHREHGVVTVRDPITIANAAEYGLEPLLIFGVTAVGLPLRFVQFGELADSFDVGRFLTLAWTAAEGMKGVPDRVRVSSALASSCLDFVGGLEVLGVDVEVAGRAEKSLPAAMRAAQTDCMNMMFVEGGQYGKKAGLAELNQIAADAHVSDFWHFGRSHGSASGDMLRRQQAWKAMEARPFPVGGSLSTACKGGRWLYSWEASVSPSIDRVFHRFNDGGPLNLVSARDARLKYGRDDVGGSEGIRFVSDDFSNFGDVARDVLLNWPNSMGDMAQAVGLSLKELRAFLRGKFECGRSAHLRLQSLLGIGYDEFYEGLVYRPAGPCALLVQNGAALERAYENYSHGGDASPFEVVPESGRADPSWRYFSLNSYGGGLIIVMCLRGEKVADRMGDILMNFEGEIEVADDVYRDVVSSCAKACLDVQRNSHEIAGLAARCGASLNNITFY